MKFLILMIVIALAIAANAECEVNGYYKANGTWVDGYTKSGECWDGEIIGYDAQGRTRGANPKKLPKNHKSLRIAF